MDLNSVSKESGIYCFENKVNGKKYIGQSINIGRRIKDHLSHLRKNSEPSMVLQNAWNKYGESNFEIYVIEYCSVDDLDSKELFYIKEYDSHVSSCGYNITFGGTGVMRDRNHSQETKDKLRRILSGRKLSTEHIHNATMGAQGVLRTSGERVCCGVTFLKENNSYAAQINFNKEHIMLGCYESEESAGRAYDIAAIFYYGENANLNFPQYRKEIISFLSDKEILDVKDHGYKTKRKTEGTLFRKKRKDCKYKYKGVSNKGDSTKRRKFWGATITVNKKRISLGVFETETHAGIAYDISSLFFYKDMSETFINFPELREKYISYLNQYEISSIKELRQIIKDYISQGGLN